MAAAKDAFLGEIKGRIPLFRNTIDDAGNILLCESGIVVNVDGMNVRSPFSFVKSIKQTGEMPLAKAAVNLVTYDQLGEKYEFDVVMSDQHLILLKKECGKE